MTLKNEYYYFINTVRMHFFNLDSCFFVNYHFNNESPLKTNTEIN